MMNDCMIDLETLSTRSNAAILSIGAVMFNEQEIGSGFYQVVRWPKIAGTYNTSVFHVEQSTLDWWEQQSDEARTVFDDPDAQYIANALSTFDIWLRDVVKADLDQLRVWGNGAAFDNTILSTAFKLIGIPQPWKHWNDRCYRTIKNQHKDIKAKRTGTHHNALDDAVTQAEHMIAMGVTLA